METLIQYKDKRLIEVPVQLQLKPVGPSCNLQCKYCFYSEKAALSSTTELATMSEAVLEESIRAQCAAQPKGVVTFSWRGGEPLLAGRAFFERAMALEAIHAEGRPLRNIVETNGTLIDAEWAALFAKHNMTVQVSIDGPEKYHDRYRLRKCGGGSFAEVMAGIRHLQAAGVGFQTLTAVHRGNEGHPLEIYQFLKELGPEQIHFSPVVEREANQRARDLGLNLATPPPLRRNLKCQPRVSSWSVTPPGYARFLIEVFEVWIRHDVGRILIEPFEDSLQRWLGATHGDCTFNETCGNAITVERDGTLYACDRFVYPQYRRGSILKEGVDGCVESSAQEAFGFSKKKDLPQQCRRCEFRFACNGGCPKNRFSRSTEGEPGLNYLCSGYMMMFRHFNPYFQIVRRLVEQGREPAEVMDLLARIPRAVG